MFILAPIYFSLWFRYNSAPNFFLSDSYSFLAPDFLLVDSCTNRGRRFYTLLHIHFGGEFPTLRFIFIVAPICFSLWFKYISAPKLFLSDSLSFWRQIFCSLIYVQIGADVFTLCFMFIAAPNFSLFDLCSFRRRFISLSDLNTIRRRNFPCLIHCHFWRRIFYTLFHVHFGADFFALWFIFTSAPILFSLWFKYISEKRISESWNLGITTAKVEANLRIS